MGSNPTVNNVGGKEPLRVYCDPGLISGIPARGGAHFFLGHVADESDYIIRRLFFSHNVGGHHELWNVGCQVNHRRGIFTSTLLAQAVGGGEGSCLCFRCLLCFSFCN